MLRRLASLPLRRPAAAPLAAGVRCISSGSVEITVPLNFWAGKRRTGPEKCSKDSVYEPATGRVLCQLEPCGAVEVDQAVKAAKLAFGYWSKMSGMERARVMIEAAHIVEVFVVYMFFLVLFLFCFFRMKNSSTKLLLHLAKGRSHESHIAHALFNI